MTVQSFYDDLANSVRSRALLDNEYTSSAFFAEVADRLVEAEEIANLLPMQFEGFGLRNRKLAVSGYDLDDADGSIALAVLSYSGSAEVTTITSAVISKAFASLMAFLSESLTGVFQEGREESSPEWQLAEDLRERGTSVTRFRLYLITDGVTSDRMKTLESDAVGGVPVDLRIWDIARLQQVWESQQGREELEVDLTSWLPDGLPVLRASEQGDDGFTTYLACVPGDVIADLYGKYGSRLLESNVRSFLSARGKVNRGIKTTIAREPKMFLAFNNGITATATGVTANDTGNLVEVRDLQIVNGGQTTASLFYLRREQGVINNALSEVAVQMKLVVVDGDRAQDLVPQISRFANSQNRVNEIDFFSNSPFHVRMEDLSRRVLGPATTGGQVQTKWFYERTRGQYQNEVSKRTVAEARKFQVMFPKAQLITKTDIARYINCWEGRPHVVSAGAQRSFVAFAETAQVIWQKTPDALNEQYYRELIGKAILYRDIRHFVSRADWYEQGYLANIVAYTIARISQEVTQTFIGRKLDLDAVWLGQSIAQGLANCAVDVAEAVLGRLTADNRRLRNVTEWAKTVDCWDSVRDMPWPSKASLEPYLVSSAVVSERRQRAVSNQKLDVGIAAQTKVLEMGQSFWAEVKLFGEGRRLLSPTDIGILEVGSGQRRGAIPNERQAGRLLDILARCDQAGYKPSLGGQF